MVFVFGHLPSNIEEKDIRDLLKPFATVSDVFFFEKNENGRASEYECMVTLDISSRIVGFILQNRLNHYCWKGHCISSRMLIF